MTHSTLRLGMYYYVQCRENVLISTLNASTKTELLASYLRLAGHLGIRADIRELPVEERLTRGLQMVSNAVRFELQKKQKWLLIVDNLSSELKGTYTEHNMLNN